MIASATVSNVIVNNQVRRYSYTLFIELTKNGVGVVAIVYIRTVVNAAVTLGYRVKS
jgi:hypothetical protein